MAQKGHCRALFFYFVYLLNQRQLDAYDVEAFTKVTFIQKTIQPVTTYSEKAILPIQLKIR